MKAFPSLPLFDRLRKCPPRPLPFPGRVRSELDRTSVLHRPSPGDVAHASPAGPNLGNLGLGTVFVVVIVALGPPGHDTATRPSPLPARRQTVGVRETGWGGAGAGELLSRNRTRPGDENEGTNDVSRGLPPLRCRDWIRFRAWVGERGRRPGVLSNGRLMGASVSRSVGWARQARCRPPD